MKICNHEGCVYNQFGGGFCRIHQYLRKKDRKVKSVDKPRNKKKYPRTNNAKTFRLIRKVTEKGKARRREKAEFSRRDRELWNTIWQERPHVDFETDEPIYGEPLTLYFHHVLPKHDGPGGYPQFRYKKWNIIIVSWDTHTKAENNIDLVPKIKAYRDKLLKTKIK
jgi:hypothetical protein